MNLIDVKRASYISKLEVENKRLKEYKDHQAAREIADLRRCLCVAVDAYCHGDVFSHEYKLVVLSDKWHAWAQHLIRGRVRSAIRLEEE